MKHRRVAINHSTIVRCRTLNPNLSMSFTMLNLIKAHWIALPTNSIFKQIPTDYLDVVHHCRVWIEVRYAMVVTCPMHPFSNFSSHYWGHYDCLDRFDDRCFVRRTRMERAWSIRRRFSHGCIQGRMKVFLIQRIDTTFNHFSRDSSGVLRISITLLKIL